MSILHMHECSSIIYIYPTIVQTGNGNEMETGNWKLKVELETEIEMQPLSCCSQVILGANVHKLCGH